MRFPGLTVFVLGAIVLAAVILAAWARRDALAKMMPVPLREPVTWFTAAEKAHGKVTPLREFTDERGRRCRDFVEQRSLRAMNGHTSGTACL